MKTVGDDLGHVLVGPSLSGHDGRRALPEAEERATLRFWLMDRYRAEPRYQGIVQQDLGELWRRAVAAPGWQEGLPPSSLSFMDVVHQVTQFEQRLPEPPASAPALRYVQAVARTVAVAMGLLDHDLPASWALQHVHDDVTGHTRHARLLAVSPRAQDDALSVRLDLTPNYVGVRYYPNQVGTEALPDQEFDLSTLGIGYAPEHWTQLEGFAVGIIREAIIVMREDVGGRHPFRNPTFIARWGADLDVLHRVLFHRDQPSSRAERSRLRRLAGQLGIDPPSPRRESVPLIRWPVAQNSVLESAL